MSREGQAALEAPERARLFALAPFGQGYSPSEHDRICATFGFDHASLPAHGRSCRQIDAVFVYMGKPSKTMIHNLQQSLRFLHLNDRRNRRLAQVANALAAGNRSRLGELIGNLPDWVSGPLRTLVVAGGRNKQRSLPTPAKLASHRGSGILGDATDFGLRGST